MKLSEPWVVLSAALLLLMAGTAFALTCGFDISCSPDQNFSTASPPPQISAVTSSGITETTVDINWNTNVDTNSLLKYGLTTAYGSTRTDTGFSSPKHTFGLIGLTRGTVYHYQITACDNAIPSVCVTSGDNSFTTTGSSDFTPPVISSVLATSVLDHNVTISFSTDEPADTNIEYDVNTAPGFAFSVFDATLASGSRSKTISGLNVLTTYKFRVSSKDAAGNRAAYVNGANFTTTDTLPAISGITVSNITSDSATVSWTTNINATSQIEYGSSTSYGFTTTCSTTGLTSHSQTMSGLSPSVTYHFRVLARRTPAGSC